MTDGKKTWLFTYVFLAVSILACVFVCLIWGISYNVNPSFYYRLERSFLGKLAWNSVWLDLGVSIGCVIILKMAKGKNAYESLPQEERRVKEKGWLAKIYRLDWYKRFEDYKEQLLAYGIIIAACPLALVGAFASNRQMLKSGAFIA